MHRRLEWVRSGTDGQLVTSGGYVHYARLACIDPTVKDVTVALREGSANGIVVLVLNVSTGLPDDFPKTLGIAMPFHGSLWATFQGGSVTNRILILAWDAL